MKHAIDAKAHAKRLFIGLNMNIAGATFGGVGEDGIDQRDHRRFHGGLLQLLQIDVVRLVDDFHLGVTKLFEHVVITDAAEAMLQSLPNGTC